MDTTTAEANAAKMREKLAKMSAQVRTGGKGTVRRKRKVHHKNAPTDDKRLQSTIKKLGVNNIPGIDEVNLFKDDGSVIHFTNPKVQASIAANTYVVTGTPQIKTLQEMLPSLLGQMGGADGVPNMDQLKSLMEQIGAGKDGAADLEAAAAALDGTGGDDDDDEVPDLVDANFDQQATGGASAAEEATPAAGEVKADA